MNGCMSVFGGVESLELCQGLSQLKAEHPSLLKKLDGLLALTEELEREANIQSRFKDLKTMVEVFKAELDPHSEREEGVLFPMMGEYIGTASGPIAVMEYEHDQAKNLIRTFLEKAGHSKLSAEEMKNASELVKNACLILIEHFSKEENVLFPMAEKMLSDDEKAELYLKIQEIK